MKRIQRLLLTAFAAIGAWLAIHFGLADRYLGPVDPKLRAVNEALPAWAVIALGCYALYCIGTGLYNFGDPGSAAEDLQKDIAEAKAGLRKKGFKTQ